MVDSRIVRKRAATLQALSQNETASKPPNERKTIRLKMKKLRWCRNVTKCMP